MEMVKIMRTTLCLMSPSQEDVPMPSSRTRSSTSSEKTFDVLCDILSQQKVDSGDTFDEAFYLVQKGPKK